MDRDLGVALWRILLDGKFSLLDTWCSFVTANHKHAITKDEWSLTFEFVHSIDGDLDKFDENGKCLGARYASPTLGYSLINPFHRF